MKIFKEIHRRSLWQVLGLYLAGGWVALQVVETLTESAELPGWVQPFALVLLVIGLPVVLATAFLQKGIGPQKTTARPFADPGSESAPSAESGTVKPGTAGTRPEGLQDYGQSGAASLFTWRNAMIGGVAAFGLWGIVATVLLLSGGGSRGSGGPGGDGDRVSIAVLPFASAGSNEESEVFSLGIHDDLLTSLSKVSSLRVTSRTSVLKYKDEIPELGELADELGVSHFVEGSVLSSGDQLRINAQLIDAETNEHLWAETYDRSLSVANVFAIQKELTQAITRELSATLLPEEVAAIETPPTANLEAYNFFMRGHTYFAEGPRADNFELAIDMYEKAVELDPEFAEAYARLGMALGMRYEVRFRPDEEMLPRALAAAERAYELDPDLPEAAIALGQYYYTGERNLNLALEHLTGAGQGAHNADLFHLLGAVQRRAGDLDASIAAWEELVRIDPLSAHYHDDLASSYGYAARWEDSDRTNRRSMELNPRATTAYAQLAGDLLTQGRLEEARAVLDEAPGDRDFWFLRREIDLLARDYEAALERSVPPLFRGEVLLFKGDRDAALLRFDSATVFLDSALAEPEPPIFAITSAALVEAARGNREEAIRLADQAIELRPVERDRLEATDPRWDKVVVLARLGDVEAALDALAHLMEVSYPGDYSATYVNLHPAMDAIRDDPRFAEILGLSADEVAGGGER